MRGEHLPDKGNIRTIRVPAPSPWNPSAWKHRALCQKIRPGERQDCEMVANGTRNIRYIDTVNLVLRSLNRHFFAGPGGIYQRAQRLFGSAAVLQRASRKVTKTSIR